MESDISDLVKKQVAEYRNIFVKLEDIEQLVFTDADVVEQYLSAHEISEDDVDLESLRDLQRDGVNSLISPIATTEIIHSLKPRKSGKWNPRTALCNKPENKL